MSDPKSAAIARPMPLSDIIDLQIRTNGPMSLATYMGLCLSHPRAGYYRTADPLGAKGDFVTAPEITQMFGELIGVFCLDLYQRLGEPGRFTLVELGPGRGTLMADALRAAGRSKPFRQALDLLLYESSAPLVADQRGKLALYEPSWIDDLDKLGEGPLLVIANEFFDALPIRQFVRKKGAWYERMIGLHDGVRVFGLSPSPIPNEAMPEAIRRAGDNELYELCLPGRQIVSRLAGELASRRGAMLLIDYGHARTRTGETLQAVRRHAYADPLANPGATDLSAHVDFEVLANAARAAKLTVQPVVTQGEFLRNLGITHRAEALKSAMPSAAGAVDAAVHRLTSHDQMGSLFKAFCAASNGLEPPGFR